MICATSLPSSLSFNWWILLSLLAVLAASVIVFNWQVRRWTTDRAWRALLDFARARDFRLSRDMQTPPEPLDRLQQARTTVLLTKKTTQLVQLETLGGSEIETPRWHILVRDLPAGAWAPTALRPASIKASLLDHFALSTFPGMGEAERFVIFGTDVAAARELSKSQARALLPPDVGLLLSGTHLILDFSARPFDPIELGRMTALADQLVAHLPVG